MSTRWGKCPSYRHHKPTRRAFVQFKRRAIYLGKHGSQASTEAYERFTALWESLAKGERQLHAALTPKDLRTAEAFKRFLAENCPCTDPSAPALDVASRAELTIFELIDRYWQHAQHFYRRDDPYAAAAAAESGGDKPDEPTNEDDPEAPPADARIPTGTAKNQKPALRRLVKVYGSTAAAKFGPLALKALRRTWVEDGLSIKTVNSYAATIKGVFKWAVSEELLPVESHVALSTVRVLRQGRGEARETAPKGPVPDAIVEKTLPHLPPAVADMVKLQRLTGCRPSEICTLRPCDVQRWTTVTDEPLPLFEGSDRQATATRELDVWEYRPAHHKTKHKKRQRLIPIGPRAQEILRPYLLPLSFTPTAFCFSPAMSEAERRERASAERMTPAEHGNRRGTNRKAAPKRKPTDRYTKDSYARAVRRACEAAFGMPEHLREAAIAAAKGKVTAAELLKLRKEAAAWRARHCWSPNRLRHSAATAIRQRYGLEGAQVVLGHSEAGTTQIYAETNWAKAVQIAREVG